MRPFYVERRMAIDYAKTRTGGRRGEIQVFNADGDLELTIPFDESARRAGNGFAIPDSSHLPSYIDLRDGKGFPAG